MKTNIYILQIANHHQHCIAVKILQTTINPLLKKKPKQTYILDYITCLIIKGIEFHQTKNSRGNSILFFPDK